MKPKKNPGADVGRRKTIFFEIGLLFSLTAAIAVFSIGVKEKKIEMPLFTEGAVVIELPPVSQQKEPEVRKLMNKLNVWSEFLNVRPNNVVIDGGIDYSMFDMDVIVIPDLGGGREVIEEPDVYVWAERMPRFQGGDLLKFRRWVFDRLNYPQAARENNVSGKVVLEFIIDRDGSLSDISVLQSPDKLLSDEAVRILENSPRWEPGLQNDMPVKIRYTLPIDFVINN